MAFGSEVAIVECAALPVFHAFGPREQVSCYGSNRVGNHESAPALTRHVAPKHQRQKPYLAAIQILSSAESILMPGPDGPLWRSPRALGVPVKVDDEVIIPKHGSRHS